MAHVERNKVVAETTVTINQKTFSDHQPRCQSLIELYGSIVKRREITGSVTERNFLINVEMK